MRLEFHDPSGVLRAAQPHAARVSTLNGKRIGFLTNEQWQAHRMMPLLQELIGQDYPQAELLAIDAFPQGNSEISKEATAALVAAAQVDAVIVGNAS